MPFSISFARFRNQLLIVFIVLGVVLGAFVSASDYARNHALNTLRTQAGNSATLNAAWVSSTFDRFRDLPFVLSQDADVAHVLESARHRSMSIDSSQAHQDILKLDRRFESLAAGIGSSALYLLDAEGRAIAASNWREPATFVGVDYRFRPYFTDAMQHGSAKHFALGTVSHLPGLYFSHRVTAPSGEAIGVVVVKIDFASLEHAWKRQNGPIFIANRQGVVLLSSIEAWRFHTLHTLDADAIETLRQSLQFGDAPLSPLPLLRSDLDSADLIETRDVAQRRPGQYVLNSTPVAGMESWDIYVLQPAQGALTNAVSAARIITLLSCIVLIGGAALLWRRQSRRREEEHERLAVMRRLETEVKARTSELHARTLQLQSEMKITSDTTARIHILQDELAQANKLTLLGQVTAGVAHEINQPVAAIRTYAENSDLQMAQGDTDGVRANLRLIQKLTERIGVITSQLRSFSRRRHADMRPACDIASAINGAVLLVDATRKRFGIALTTPALSENVEVAIDLISLEQILINLLQNAFEALADMPADRRQVAINLQYAHDMGDVHLVVTDNGPGVSAQQTDALFKPFSSDKAGGLGLGLVISRDLAREAGGELSWEQSHQGARFILTLPRHPRHPE